MHNPPSTEIPLGERLLAAVVFTDVANFSLQVGLNENRALQCVHRDFQLMAPIISRFNGRLLKTMGDGQLIYFQSAIHAVNCAVAMQLAVTEAGRTLPPAEVLQHRIGIHLGDVFVSENDVYGNGVNIAARLQSRAEIGGICISQTVYDVVKHQLALKVNYLGAQELKNISEAIHIYHLLLDTTQRGADQPAGLPGATPAPVPVPATKGSGFTLQSSLTTRATPAPRTRTSDASFHLAIMGDFSGRSSRALLEPLTNRQPLAIDIDNLDAVLSRARVWLPLLQKPGEQVELQFNKLEDFHPDQLCRQVEPLQRLVQLRKRLLNSKTAAAAVFEMHELFADSLAAAAPTPTMADSALVELILGKAPTDTPPAHPNPANGIDAIVRHLVRSSGGAASPPVADEWIEPLDLEISRQLRAILHHPDFQQMEAAWGGVALLVNAFGEENNIKLSLLDISKAELMADLETQEIETTGLYKLLASQPWALLVANYTFGDSVAELTTLERLSRIAAAIQAPMIAAAHPHLTGCESFCAQPDPQTWTRALLPLNQQRWQTLRQSAAACYLGLAAPRFLLRQPYGQASDPIDLFSFEEMPDETVHELYLWGNPAFLCGYVFCQAFLNEGWNLSSARSGAVEDMPVHPFREGDETTVKSWAETWLSERASSMMLKHGLIPIVANKNRNAVHIPNLQSIALPSQALPKLRAPDRS
ncbi:MAG: type VI secretion system contractile sheath large subunit [Verrucomicrobiota bacterium]